MEILKQIQQELEDALKLEIDYEQVKETKDGKKLLSYLRKRRRIIDSISKILERYDNSTK